MSNAVYLYTRYRDFEISGLSNDMIVAEYKELQKVRDGEVMRFLQKEKLGPFPLSIKNFQKIRGKFEEFSREKPLLAFFFRYTNGTCERLYKGKWDVFTDLETATRDFYGYNSTVPMNDVGIAYYR